MCRDDEQGGGYCDDSYSEIYFIETDWKEEFC